MRFIAFKKLNIKSMFDKNQLVYRVIPIDKLTHIDYDYSHNRAIFYTGNSTEGINTVMMLEKFKEINRKLRDDKYTIINID
jgi:hypothetical protein